MTRIYTKKDERLIVGLFLVNKDKVVDGERLIPKIRTKCPHIDENSIKMKLGNIKYLCDKYDVSNNVRISKLAHYSNQNEEVFIKVAKELNIID